MRPKSTRIARTCLHCGKHFTAEPNQVKNGGAVYCSRPCFYAARRVRETRSCPICGTSFEARPSENRIYCSAKCRNASKPSLEERFWAKVNKAGECWLWTATLNPNGYGQIGNNGRLYLAHRISWELHYGPIPDGLSVCHHCDTPACVRPDHLFVGTHAENMADMATKGRARSPLKVRKGSRHHKAKLTETNVRRIRELLRQGVRQQDIADMFGVKKATIQSIGARKTWKHVG